MKVHDLLTELEMSSLLKFCRQGGEVLAKGVGVQAFHHGFRAFLDVSEHCQSTSSEALMCLNHLVADALELVPDSLE